MSGSDRVPRGLGPDGQKLWRDITADFELENFKKRILFDACKTADLIARLEVEAAARDVVTRGSMGQDVISPTLAACAAERTRLSQLLVRMALPLSDEDEARRQEQLTSKRRKTAKLRLAK